MSEQTAITPARPGARSALALLLVINLFNYIDRYVLAAVLPPMSTEFGLSTEQSGLLASAFLYAYMIGAPLLGRLAEHMSRWWLIGISITIWSLASGWTGLASSFTMLVITRVLVGFGEAGYGPAAPALISDYFPVERRGKVLAFFYLAIPVGSALGYVFGGFMNHWLGWRSAFFVVVLPGLLLAVLCFLRREPLRDAPAVKKEKRAFIADAKALLRIPSYVLNTAAMTAMTFAIGGISFWLPKYMLERQAREYGLVPRIAIEQMNLMQSPEMRDRLNEMLTHINMTFGVIVVVAGFVSTILGGWLGDKLRTRWRGSYFVTSGFGIALAFPCTLGMLWLPVPYAWFAVFGAVFFLFFNTGPANTALANVTSSRLRATAFAFNIFVIHALGDAISPPLIGLIAGHTDWNTAFLLVSLTMVLASVLWLIGARYLGRDEDIATESDRAYAATTAA
jgi:MFS family permease